MDIKQKFYNIVGACMEVHGELRSSLVEPIYQEALECELGDRGIPFQREVHLPVKYKSHTLSKHYQMDFVCYDDVIVECKAVTQITPEHRFQLFTYIRLTGLTYGMIVNFGEKSLHVEKYVYDRELDSFAVFDKRQDKSLSNP